MATELLLMTNLWVALFWPCPVAGIRVRQIYSEKLETVTFDPERVLEDTCCVVRLDIPQPNALACSTASMEIKNCMGVYWNQSASNKCHAKRCEMDDDVWELGSGDGIKEVNSVEFYAITAVVNKQEEKFVTSNKDNKHPKNCRSEKPVKAMSIKGDCSMERAAFTFCSTTDDGKVRTGVAKKKSDGKLSFNQVWEQYRHGFCLKNKWKDYEYWIGLDALHTLTSINPNSSLELCIYLDKTATRYVCYTYSDFQVGGPGQGYRFSYSRLETKSKNIDGVLLRGCLHPAKGTRFSTPDKDHTCTDMAKKSKAGWWFHEKGLCNPFGVYYSYSTTKNYGTARFPNINWMEIDTVEMTLVEDL